jgi:uncharacterized protein YigE (DUF2233 family)
VKTYFKLHRVPRLSFGRAALLAQFAFVLLGVGAAPCIGADLLDYRMNNLSISTCRVDLRRETLRMFWKDDNKQPFNRFSRLKNWLAVRGEEIVCATNAGIFDEDFRPLGLYVESGVTLRKLNEHKNAYGNFYLQPNGVFLVRRGQAEIVDTDRFAAARDQYSSDVLFATQSGPLLIQDGKINSLFAVESENRLIRNAVCTISPYEIVLAISGGPISFYDFAKFLQKIGCANALYLDGNVSRMYPRTDPDTGPGLGPLIAVTRKTATE